MKQRSRKWHGAVAALVVAGTLAAAQEPPTPDASKTGNPDLVRELAKEMNATPQQAEGAAGALFSAAKARMSADDWSTVARAVPGMDRLLEAAPTVATGTAGSVASAAAGATGKSAGNLAGAAAAFSKLGLGPEMVSTAIPVVTRYVTKVGGSDVGSLLAGALK
jgi:hypothetical protein